MRIVVMDLHCDMVTPRLVSTNCLELTGRHCPELEGNEKDAAEIWTDASPKGRPINRWTRMIQPKPGFKFDPKRESHLFRRMYV